MGRVKKEISSTPQKRVELKCLFYNKVQKPIGIYKYCLEKDKYISI